jgi:hypothetical protein
VRNRLWLVQGRHDKGIQHCGDNSKSERYPCADALKKVQHVLSLVSPEKLKLRQGELALNIWRRLGQAIIMCCFAGTPVSILMWSHYSGGHTGVCLEVDVSSISDYVYPVNYSDALPSISPLAFVDVETGKAAGLFESLFLRKATCWSYEAEHRIMRVAKGMAPEIRSHADKFMRNSISRIILGMAMSSENRERLTHYVRKNAPNIRLGFAIPSYAGAYALKIVDENGFES